MDDRRVAGQPEAHRIRLTVRLVPPPGCGVSRVGVLHPVLVKRTLVAATAVLAVLLLAGCSDDPDGPSPSPSVSTSAAEQTQGPAAATEDPSAGGQTTIAADDVTAAQKKACLEAIVAQI